ncbi:MAG: phosphoribosylanthranilate isomerase [Deltaproteobacteria bacterium]|nr:phosphoribosylanthranilate isomerase [Deltaproteobacteria bacterium]
MSPTLATAGPVPPGRPLIKVCGLTRPQDSTLAAILGADMCGFIFHPPSPRSVTASRARLMPTPGVRRVGVFVDQGLQEILEFMEEACLDVAQLHGAQGPEVAGRLPPGRVIRVFWPESQDSGELARQMDEWRALAHLYLFDAGSGGGGHGRRLAADVPESPVPYLLAGGLSPAQVRRRWPADDPMLAGFDLNSGLELSPGQKDGEALKSLLPWPRRTPAGPA